MAQAKQNKEIHIQLNQHAVSTNITFQITTKADRKPTAVHQSVHSIIVAPIAAIHPHCSPHSYKSTPSTYAATQTP